MSIGPENFKGRHFISALDFSREEIEYILDKAGKMERGNPAYKSSMLMGTGVVFLCYGESLRTLPSFRTASENIGAKFTDVFGDPESTNKQLLHDDIEHYVHVYDYDIIIVRHSDDDSARYAVEAVEDIKSRHNITRPVAVISAGNGKREHVTHMFSELYGIKKYQGKIDGLEIGIMGNLENGRAAHSTFLGLSKFECNVHLFSNPDSSMPDYILKEGDNYLEHRPEVLPDFIHQLDVLSLLRYGGDERSLNEFVLNPNLLERAKHSLMIYHSGPKRTERDREIDGTSHDYRLAMARCGIPTKQTIMCLQQGEKIPDLMI